MSSLRPAIQLATDSEDDMSGPIKPSEKRLRGWRVLLLCLPACCDLAGTTVSPFSFPYQPKYLGSLPLTYTLIGLAHQRRPAFNPGFNISDDPWCPCSVCWCIQRHLPPPSLSHIPVKSHFIIPSTLRN